MSMEDFGKRLLNLRQNANMTQEELALRIGVTPQAISKWERGQSFPDISIFADLCRVLNVSADWLLGLEHRNYTENNDQEIWSEILKNLCNCLEPVAIIFGIDVVQAFIDTPYVESMAAERMQMSKEGFLLPIVRLQDDVRLDTKEYVVVIYNRVIHREQLEVIDETTLEYIMHIFGQVVRKNYGMLLSRDIVKALTDNLRDRYPALINGIIPEKISYGLLQEVLKRFLDRGNSLIYLTRVIESLESALYKNPDASVEALAEQVCADLESPDNITFFYAGMM